MSNLCLPFAPSPPLGTVDIQNVTAFGGEAVTSVVQLGSRTVRIDVNLVPGGTLQIAVPTGVTISWALFIP